MTRAQGTIAGVLLLLLLGCSGGLVDGDPALVTRLRVLSIVAEPAEPRPGDSVTLSALLADPDATTARTYQFAWGICTPLLASPGQPSLFDPSACGDEANVAPLGVGTSLTITVPANLLDGYTAEERALGLDLPVVLRATASGGDRDVGLKRLRVSESTNPNQNPEVTAFTFDGVDPAPDEAVLPWPVDVRLSAQVADEDADWTIEFFVTEGRMPEGNLAIPVQSSRLWLTDGGDAPAGSTVYVVARDGRGGNGWAVRQVRFTP